jgi:hypothetical protein
MIPRCDLYRLCETVLPASLSPVSRLNELTTARLGAMQFKFGPTSHSPQSHENRSKVEGF